MNNDSTEQIAAHIEKYLGCFDNVIHEVASPLSHLDVIWVNATPERPYHVLVTSGMSNLPMPIPLDNPTSPYLELMMVLPAEWRVPTSYEILGKSAQTEDEWQWPIKVLTMLARYPHLFDTWFGVTHTIPNNDPPEPYANTTQFCGAILLPSLYVPAEFLELKISEKKIINFLSVVPLYQEEMQFKLDHGTNALLDLFEQYQVDDFILPNRINMALG